MERRKFIKYSSLAGFGASLFPVSFMGDLTANGASKLVHFSAASTQIRHGALNLPFGKFLKEELPFNWLLDVQQNIFFKDGFQRNESEDMHIMSLALQNKNEFEALQVSIQSEQIGFLWKDEYILNTEFKSIQKIALEDDVFTFQLACLEGDQNVTVDLQEGVSYFVQVLEGEVQNEQAVLNPNTGLGIHSTNARSLNFQANSKSKFLIIARY